MINIKHIGIYVNDLEKMGLFYQNVFSMHIVCEKEKDANELLDELIMPGVQIYTTKLITDYGKVQGTGDMIELVKVINKVPDLMVKVPKIDRVGTAHIAMGVDDIENVCNRFLNYGGNLKTSVITMKNGNKCCFGIDPEKNWVELIQRGK